MMHSDMDLMVPDATASDPLLTCTLFNSGGSPTAASPPAVKHADVAFVDAVGNAPRAAPRAEDEEAFSAAFHITQYEQYNIHTLTDTSSAPMVVDAYVDEADLINEFFVHAPLESLNDDEWMQATVDERQLTELTVKDILREIR